MNQFSLVCLLIILTVYSIAIPLSTEFVLIIESLCGGQGRNSLTNQSTPRPVLITEFSSPQ